MRISKTYRFRSSRLVLRIETGCLFRCKESTRCWEHRASGRHSKPKYPADVKLSSDDNSDIIFKRLTSRYALDCAVRCKPKNALMQFAVRVDGLVVFAQCVPSRFVPSAPPSLSRRSALLEDDGPKRSHLIWLSHIPATPCFPDGSWTFHSTTIAPPAGPFVVKIMSVISIVPLLPLVPIRTTG